MKIKNITQLNDFIAAVEKCSGEVWLESPQGDKYNLKSQFSRYIALGELLSDCGDQLELFCARKDDEPYFLKYLRDHPEVQM